MALFTDGAPASIDDLRRYDSSAESLSHEASIDLDAKLAVAAEEVGQEIFTFLLFQASGRNSMGEDKRRRTGLSDVVVTSPVRRWHALRALAGLYRDAYSSDVTNRYRLKWEAYEKLAKEAEDYAFTTGIGLTKTPIPKAPVAVVTQTGQAAERIDCSIRITWLGSGGAEGAPSDPWVSAIGAGDRVSIPDAAPDSVAGWNLYAGAGDDLPRLQNECPMPLDTAWTKPEGALSPGRPVGQASVPDYIVVERRMIPWG